MIKSVTVTNHVGDSVVLSLTEPEKTGFVVRDIRNLGPVKATINTSRVGSLDGVVYNSATASGRNLVFALGFLPFPTLEATRLLSYKFFPLKQEVKIVIETDTRMLQTTGRIESNEPVIFAEMTGCDVSIVCEDAYFSGHGPDAIQVTDMYGVDPLFEFPFGNKSLTVPTLEMGQAQTVVETNIFYAGDVDTGMTITLLVTGGVTNPKIANLQTLETLEIESAKIPGGIIAGDKIIIVTERGKKSARLLRAGVYTNILTALGRRPSWFRLFRGDNLYAYTAASGAANLKVQIENQTLYEGA